MLLLNQCDAKLIVILHGSFISVSFRQGSQVDVVTFAPYMSGYENCFILQYILLWSNWFMDMKNKQSEDYVLWVVLWLYAGYYLRSVLVSKLYCSHALPIKSLAIMHVSMTCMDARTHTYIHIVNASLLFCCSCKNDETKFIGNSWSLGVQIFTIDQNFKAWLNINK